MRLIANHMARPLTLGIGAVLFLIALFFALSPSVAEPAPQADIEFRGTQLVRPEGYREWIYVGTPVTPNELNPPEAAFPEFHNVYIHPDDFAYYKRTGEFPDGTILVKELVTAGSKAATSGNGYFMGEYVGLEATIKDSTRFPNEPGNWAYFSFGHEYPLADAAEPFPTAACNACHDASAAEDFVFTQYYPVLRAAKAGGQAGGSGTMRAGTPAFDDMSAAMSGALNQALQPTAATGRGPIPTGQDALFTYLTSRRYESFSARESAQHPSIGPHTKSGLPVRVYVNDTLDASMKASNTSHPVGSGAVKEMYDGDGDLQGWAVMQKTQADSDGGKGWFWYEVTSTTDGSSPVGIGNGIPLCSGCHSIGTDFVLTRYPLR